MKNIILPLVLFISLSSCSKGLYDIAEVTNNNEVYEEFWHHVYENYIYFNIKGVDWNEVYERHGSSLHELTTDQELFEAIELSLLELKDTHNNLLTPLGRGRVHNYKDGYDIYFDKELVERTYIKGTFEQVGSFNYGQINETTQYVYVPKMENIRSLRGLLRSITTERTKSVIIDLRNNPGGNSNEVPLLLGDFVKDKTYLGGYIEKSGPNIDDLTDPISIYAEPSSTHNYNGKVIILTNRVGYSATTYMAAMCKGLPNFTIVGQVTGGGGGGNAGFELSNGWLVSVSVSDFVDKEGSSIELGVEPDVKVENTKQDIEEGRDVMLEKALSLR